MQHNRGKNFICAIITVWSTLLLENAQAFQSYDEWGAPPSMDAFENYKDMQRYIKDKESRSLKKLANPLDDSYINAYNFHHDSPRRSLAKRSAEPIDPKSFKFEIGDAKEPDEATKELIRIHSGRELQLGKVAEKARNLILSKKAKRSAEIPELHVIRFEVSDAMEPDEATKVLIKQGRARELGLTTEHRLSTTNRPSQIATKKLTREGKRVRRSLQVVQPQIFRFELQDAKTPNINNREMMRQVRERQIQTDPIKQHLHQKFNETHNMDDSFVEESKRIFFTQVLPTRSKSVANSLPLEVKKIIDMILKDNNIQAYYNYAPIHEDAKLKSLGNQGPIAAGLMSLPSAPTTENLIALYPEPAYVQKFVSVPLPVQTFPVNILSPPSKPTQPLAYPIQNHEKSDKQRYHHTNALYQSDSSDGSYLKVVPAVTQVFHEIPTSTVLQEHQRESSLNSINSNEISRQYPYEKIIPLEPSYRYEKHLTLYSPGQSQEETLTNDHTIFGNKDGLFNSEHQKQLIKQNISYQKEKQIPLNDMQEFRELSTLIGKSPTDQIHGLAYLLAKEMQRSKSLNSQRPQDNTSPILFHPEKNRKVNSLVDQEQNSNKSNISSQSIVEPQPIQEEPLRDYDEIPENKSGVTYISQFKARQNGVVFPTASPPSKSFNVAKALGLSPNYKGIDKIEAIPPIHSEIVNNHQLQYASKYAFGYRVHDFSSGNDFGHRQNQDVDGVTHGQYHILLPDGRVQNVIYHADDSGFHANVSFETGHH